MASNSVCIGIRYKGVMYPPDKPPKEMIDKLAKCMKEMLEQRRRENNQFNSVREMLEDEHQKASNPDIK